MRYACVLTVVFSLLIAAPRATAQTAHTASQSALDAAVRDRVTAVNADRELVKRLLDRADVKAVAEGAGIDIRSAATAVSGMDADTLAAVASQARVVDHALTGGQSTVTISTTAIIIGLLVLIVILVAT